MSRGALVAMAIAGLLLVSLRGTGPTGSAGSAESDQPTVDPLGPNAACYVCHLTFVREELSKTHLRAKIACVKCHGLSAKHANDENIGATKPDITFERVRVSAACRKCHPKHDVPPAKVVGRWLERQPIQSPPVCTDCHGRHHIETPEEKKQ